jgi:DNA primase
MDGSNPKYLNTKQTKIFNKSSILWNFNNIDIECDKIIIVEGYMDAIAFYRAGYKNVVALMGVEISTKHISLLNTLNNLKTIILCFDNDNAGTNANINIGKTLVEEGFNVYIHGEYDKQYKDIDELLNKTNQESVVNVINNRRDYITFLIDNMFSTEKPQDEIQAFVNQMIEFIKENGDMLLRTRHIRYLSNKSHIEYEDLLNKFNNDIVRTKQNITRPVILEEPKIVNEAQSITYKNLKNQKLTLTNYITELIKLCLIDNSLLENITDEIDVSSLKKYLPEQTYLLKICIVLFQEHNKVTKETIEEYIENELKNSPLLNSILQCLNSITIYDSIKDAKLVFAKITKLICFGTYQLLILEKTIELTNTNDFNLKQKLQIEIKDLKFQAKTYSNN